MGMSGGPSDAMLPRGFHQNCNACGAFIAGKSDADKSVGLDEVIVNALVGHYRDRLENTSTFTPWFPSYAAGWWMAISGIERPPFGECGQWADSLSSGHGDATAWKRRLMVEPLRG